MRFLIEAMLQFGRDLIDERVDPRLRLAWAAAVLVGCMWIGFGLALYTIEFGLTAIWPFLVASAIVGAVVAWFILRALRFQQERGGRIPVRH
jgi:hypothetical protein